MKPQAPLCSDFKMIQKHVLSSLRAQHPKNTRATPKNRSSKEGITKNLTEFRHLGWA